MSDPRAPTIKDVAKVAGVSVSSVSRYLADPKSVRPLAAYSIKNAVRELRFEPNAFARSLRKRRADVVGIVVPYTEFFFGKACAAVSDFFYERNFGAFICESDNDPEKERFYVQSLLNLHAAGLVIAPTGHNTEYLRDVVERHRNVVVMDRREEIGCEIVAMDFDRSAYILARHVLATRPCDSVTLLMGAQGACHMRECLKGLERAFREAGRSFEDVRQVHDCFRFVNVSAAVRGIADALRGPKRPAVFALGSSMVEDAVAVLNQCGKDALRRVDLAGFAMKNVIDKLGFHFPCVMQNPDGIGTAAAELLHGKITGGKKTRRKLVGNFLEIEPEIRLEK